MSPRLIPLAAAGIALALCGAVSAEPRIEIEVCTEPGYPLTGARHWNEMLGELGLASVRIRGAKPGDEPAIKTSGKEPSLTYRVTGILTADDKLVLPRGRFTKSDRGRLAAWLEKLKAGGEEGVTVKPAAFGLLPSQLVKVHEALAVPVRFSTAGKPPRDVARQIAEGLALKFISDTTSQKALGTQEPVADELEGLTSGTALAAVLRPLGLVLVPEKSGSDLRLRITDSRSANEHWPVGWPSKDNPGQTLPELFKFLNVEITDTSLGESLAAIGGRV